MSEEMGFSKTMSNGVLVPMLYMLDECYIMR